MPRYEKPDDDSGKYWEIILKGLVVWTRSGKLGAGVTSEWNGERRNYERRGRATEREFADTAAAQAELERLTARKIKDGYTLVVDSAAAPVPPVDAQVLTNAALEAAILAAADDDPAPFLVYADWLESHGDPRGELISLQHAMRLQSDPAAFVGFKKRAEVLRLKHQALWLGPQVVAFEYRLRLDWRLGFVMGARADAQTRPGEVPLSELLAELLASPAGRFMRQLTLRGGPEIASALPSPLPPSLRKLQLHLSGTTTREVEKRRRALEQQGLEVTVTETDSP